MPTRDASSRRDAAWKPTSPKSTTAAWRISSRLARPWRTRGRGRAPWRGVSLPGPARRRWPRSSWHCSVRRPTRAHPTDRAAARAVPAPGRARFRTRGRASGRARRCSTTARHGDRRPVGGGRRRGLGRGGVPGSVGSSTSGGAARRASAVAAVTVPSGARPCAFWNARSAVRVASSIVPVTATSAPCTRSRSWTQDTDAVPGSVVGDGVGVGAVGAGVGSTRWDRARARRRARARWARPAPGAARRRARGRRRARVVGRLVRRVGRRDAVTSGRGVSGRGVTAGTVSSPFAPPSAETSPTTTASPPPVAAPTMPATATTSVTAPAPAATVTHGVAVRRAGRGRGRCGPARRVRTGRGVGARRLLPGLSRGRTARHAARRGGRVDVHPAPSRLVCHARRPHLRRYPSRLPGPAGRRRASDGGRNAGSALRRKTRRGPRDSLVGHRTGGPCGTHEGGPA